MGITESNIQLNYINDGLYHLTGEGVSRALSVDVVFFIVALQHKHNNINFTCKSKIRLFIRHISLHLFFFLLLKHRAEKTMTCPSVGDTYLHQPALVSIHFYFVSIT